MRARNGTAMLFALAAFVWSAAAAEPRPSDRTVSSLTHNTTIHIITQIQRADYEGDRAALKRLHDELAPIPTDNKLASRVLYWRGFAMWRRAINGFNETPTPTDLEEDLTQAITDFKDSIDRDPAFVEPKIGAGSSFGYLMYLHRKDQARVQQLPTVESTFERSLGSGSRQSATALGARSDSLVVATGARRRSGKGVRSLQQRVGRNSQTEAFERSVGAGLGRA